MWKEGTLKVNGKTYRYWIKQYDIGSVYGIDGGRISKLMIKRGNKIVCNYERGWDIEPTDAEAEEALNVILKAENH
jgi:hypothetical protein